MICKYCGHEISDNSKFCIFCGNIIQRPEEMEIPVRVLHNTHTDTQVKELEQDNAVYTQNNIEIPTVENIPEIEIINIEKEQNKEPMHHNEEKLKLIQDFDASLNKVVKPDTEELLEGITNKAEKPKDSIEEIVEPLTIDSIEAVDENKSINENNTNTHKTKSKKPEIVYLDGKGFTKKFSIDKENKVLNILIVVFGVLVIALALKTFVF